MRRHLPLVVLLLAFLLPVLSALAAPAEPTVYVTPKGYAYHVSGCRTLSRSKTVDAVPLSKAKDLGRTPCKVCEPPR